MLVHEAKAIASEWVTDFAPTLLGFQGAFFHGSVNWMPDDAALTPMSDLDVIDRVGRC